MATGNTIFEPPVGQSYGSDLCSFRALFLTIEGRQSTQLGGKKGIQSSDQKDWDIDILSFLNRWIIQFWQNENLDQR